MLHFSIYVVLPSILCISDSAKPPWNLFLCFLIACFSLTFLHMLFLILWVLLANL